MLWDRMRDPAVNRARGLAGLIDAITIETIVAEYRAQSAAAPRRHPARKYLQHTHTGQPHSGATSGRVEEHLMLALYGTGQNTLATPTSRQLRIIDYQVPLKAKRSDPIGKVDGLGLTDRGSVCLIELKAPRHRGDSPLRALLESLSYLAVVEANWPDLASEIAAAHSAFDPAQRPTALIAGPRSWWTAWEGCTPAGDWKQSLADLTTATAQSLDVSIAYGALDGHGPDNLHMGLNGQAPTLTEWPTLGPVPGLPELS